MRFIGIDPGKKGALAYVGRDTEHGYTCTLDKLTEQDIWKQLAEWEIDSTFAVVEKVHSSPQMGVKSAFTFGRGYGVLVACLTAAQIPFVEVTPSKWQRSLGCLTKGDKNVSKRKAQQLFPTTKITHGNADALLIATYCRQHVSELF